MENLKNCLLKENLFRCQQKHTAKILKKLKSSIDQQLCLQNKLVSTTYKNRDLTGIGKNRSKGGIK